MYLGYAVIEMNEIDLLTITKVAIQLLAKLMYLVKEVKYYDRYTSFKNSLPYVKTQVINVASTQLILTNIFTQHVVIFV